VFDEKKVAGVCIFCHHHLLFLTTRLGGFFETKKNLAAVELCIFCDALYSIAAFDLSLDTQYLSLL